MSAHSLSELRLAPDRWPAEALALVQHLEATVNELRDRTAQLQQALESRVLIEQAKGVLAERLGVRPEEAFLVLRRAARSSQMRLHELAGQVVSSRATPAPVAHEVARLRREEALR